MFLRFGLENHASFRDPAELSFISTAQTDSPSWRLTASPAPHGVLPAVGIWGANASGKSNLVMALKVFRNRVRDSFLGFTPEELIPWHPFAMRKDPDVPSTRMDLDLVVDNIRYHYGFRFRSKGYLEEWLFAWPRNRRQVLFHRNHAENDPWYFGPSLRGQRQVIANATRSNSLFLSAAAQYNHEQLTPIYTTITQGIRSERRIKLQGYPLFESDSLVLDPRMKSSMLAFLTAADLGVVGMRSAEVPTNRNEESLNEVFHPEFLKKLSETRGEQPQLFELRLLHGGALGSPSWELDPSRESRGTQILLRRMEDFLEVLRDGGLLVLDELDTSLHPDLCAALVSLFVDPDVNPRHAQLLFTTHDRGLLGILRRDEVVLVDKAQDGASSLRTASDYAEVRGRDDLRRAHELGRIDSVPILGDIAGTVARALEPGHAS